MIEDNFKSQYKSLPIAVSYDTGVYTNAHNHREFEILYFQKGSAEVTVNNKVYLVSEGDMFFVNPYEVHAIRFIPKNGLFARICICFDCNIITNETISKSLNNEDYKIMHHIKKKDPINKYLSRNFLELINAYEDGSEWSDSEITSYITLLFIKLIKSEPEPTSRIWDNKYNIDANAAYGKTIYKDSIILSYLTEDYKNGKKISKNARAHVVAQDVCIGKRNANDYTISKNIDCSEILENQVISLINVSDYAMASADPDCKYTNSKSCRNYNYLANLPNTWTLTANSKNTYEVYKISNYVYSSNAEYDAQPQFVITISADALYNSGDGTEDNPYIIK